VLSLRRILQGAAAIATIARMTLVMVSRFVRPAPPAYGLDRRAGWLGSLAFKGTFGPEMNLMP